jgi:hypothetical protein
VEECILGSIANSQTSIEMRDHNMPISQSHHNEQGREQKLSTEKL